MWVVYPLFHIKIFSFFVSLNLLDGNNVSFSVNTCEHPLKHFGFLHSLTLASPVVTLNQGLLQLCTDATNHSFKLH